MIYDCFTFFNELDLLDIRLNVLNDYVDKFVLVESPYTHSGFKKQLFFKENKYKFEKFKDKIVTFEYVPQAEILENKPNNFTWILENLQRNSILNALLTQKSINNDDIVVVSDVDEIPDPIVLRNIVDAVSNNNYTIRLIQKMHYYYLDCLDIGSLDWGFEVGSYVTRFENLMRYSPQCFRDSRNIQLYANCGWHFSYLGGIDAIVNKIQSFAHAELNKLEFIDKEEIRKKYRRVLIYIIDQIINL